MTTPRLSALLALSDNFRTWLTTPEATVAMGQLNLAAPPNVTACGWKQREQQLNQGPGRANRVIFIPGSIDGDDLGRFTQPRRGRVNPRTIYTWERLVTAAIWAVDSTATTSEEAQIEASENLLVLVVQGLQRLAGPADFDASGHGPRRDRKASANFPFGQEILLEFVHREDITDIAQTIRTNVTPSVTKSPSA